MAILKILQRFVVLILGPVLIGAISIMVYLNGGRYITTENAYLKSEIITVSAEMIGKVSEILIRENARVNRGDLVVSLHEEPSLVAIAQAEASLANIQAELLSQMAEYESRKLDIVKAETDFDFRPRLTSTESGWRCGV